MLILKCWNIQISKRLSPYETGIRCPSYKMSFQKKKKAGVHQTLLIHQQSHSNFICEVIFQPFSDCTGRQQSLCACMRVMAIHDGQSVTQLQGFNFVSLIDADSSQYQTISISRIELSYQGGGMSNNEALTCQNSIEAQFKLESSFDFRI